MARAEIQENPGSVQCEGGCGANLFAIGAPWCSDCIAMVRAYVPAALARVSITADEKHANRAYNLAMCLVQRDRELFHRRLK